MSMIEQEVIDAVRAEHGIDLSDDIHRRNVVTTGIRLVALNGKLFRIGSALFGGVRVCSPLQIPGATCWARNVQTGALRRSRGIAGGCVLQSGSFAAGDTIHTVDSAALLAAVPPDTLGL